MNGDLVSPTPEDSEMSEIVTYSWLIPAAITAVALRTAYNNRRPKGRLQTVNDSDDVGPMMFKGFLAIVILASWLIWAVVS